MVTCNTTLEDLGINETPLHIGITFHHLALILSAVFGIIAIIISLYLLVQHANHYSRPLEQKYIIRILFMIPVYSIANFLSLMFYQHAIYFTVLSDCYEAFAIASFFTLMCNYLAPNLHDQKDFFRAQIPKNWSWVSPIRPFQKCTGGEDKGIFRKPRSGLTWFNIIWICVFQYCFIRVFFTVVSVLTQATGTYCEASLSPAFAHIWVTCFEGLSVTIAMVGLIQFYIQLKEDLAEHKPGLKLLCIKLVIFFSFWQSLLISLMSSSSGPLKPNQYVGYQDIKNGVPAVLSCVEMAIFSVLHIFAFPWRNEYAIRTGNSKITSATPYAEDPLNAYGAGYSGVPQYYGGFLGWKAYADACNPWDLIKASARGFRWLFVGRKKRHLDSSYRARNSVLDAGTRVNGSTKLAPLSGNDAGVKHGVISQHDDDDDWDDNTEYTSGRLPGQPSTAYHGVTSYQGQHLAPQSSSQGGMYDSASDISDDHIGGRDDDFAGYQRPGAYQNETEDHRASLLSHAAPSPSATRRGQAAPQVQVQPPGPPGSIRKPSPYSAEPVGQTHPAFRIVGPDQQVQQSQGQFHAYGGGHEGPGGGGGGPGNGGWV